MAQTRNNHHIFYERAVWESRPELKALRTRCGLIVRMEVEAHDALHEAVIAVPAPDRHVIGAVNRLYEPQQTKLGSIDNVCSAFEQVGKHPLSNNLQRTHVGLIVDAIRQQIPFIREGMYGER